MFDHKRTRHYMLLLISLVFSYCSVKADPGSLQDIRISLDMDQVTLAEVFSEIETTTPFVFFYRNADLDLNRIVSVKVVNSPIEKVLDILFHNQRVHYEIVEKQIIIKKIQSSAAASLSSEPKSEGDLVINGIVMDMETGKPIPFCNIALPQQFKGTASNEQGEFVIEVAQFPTTLLFSHINYGQFSLEIIENSELTVRLEPLRHNLEEVTVLAGKKNNYAADLANKAYRKALTKTSKQRYAKAFYRQKSKNGDQFAEFSEIFFDIRYSTKGIEDWQIVEGRYALKESAVYNRNYTLLSRLLKPLQPNTEDLIFPLHPQLEVYYHVRVTDLIESPTERFVVLQFKPKGNSPVPIFEGEVVINARNFNILKVKGTLSQDDLDLVRLKEKNSYWENYNISYEIAYVPGDSQVLSIDYIKIDQAFDYYKDDRFQFNVASTSNLLFFEFYSPSSRKRLGNSFRKSKSDWDKLDQIGYNRVFWDNNPIIKRTPIEEEVISSFESDKAFNSVFLNSRNQVTVLNSNVSGDPVFGDLKSQLNSFNRNHPIEKAYLHTDRETYTSGEDLQFSSYVVMGPYSFYSTSSNELHLELFDSADKLVGSYECKLSNGKCSGTMQLGSDLPSGAYLLKAYTDRMYNTDPNFIFEKSLRIVNPDKTYTAAELAGENINLTFLPEGGNILENIPAVITFKARGTDGLPKVVKGKIVDQHGKTVAPIKTLVEGMGFFSLKCEPNSQYRAVLNNGTEHFLPSCTDKGYSLNVNNSSDNSIKVTVRASTSQKDKEFYVIGHIRNKIYYQGRFIFEDEPAIIFEIPKTRLPSGVMTLTLFDEDKNIWSERPLLINNQETLVINTELRRNSLAMENKVNLEVEITDAEGNPVITEFSVAVTDVAQLEEKNKKGNIASYLSFQSELMSYIKYPEALLKDPSRSASYQLDMLVQTSGNRVLEWEKVWKGSNQLKPSTGDAVNEISDISQLRQSSLSPNSQQKPARNAIDDTSGDGLPATYYWNSNLKTNPFGKVSIPLDPSLLDQGLLVHIEALSSYGIPGSYTDVVGN